MNKPPKKIGAHGRTDTIEVAQPERGAVLAQRYRVLGHLGSGGMGTVYEVEDEHLEERIALKLLHLHLSADRSFRNQIAHEVRLARRVSHPNVCRVHDLGRYHGQVFVTMELVRGDSLRAMIRNLESPQLARKIDILIQLCSALSAAHRAGVLHRDIKPDNVVVSEERAVLTDFGVASLVNDPRGRGTIAGTAAYMAPELILGATADVRVDVYSTAVLAYELLSGRPPFQINSITSAAAHAEKPTAYPPLPETSAPATLCESLDKVLANALSPEPSERPASIDRFAELLARAARGESTAPAASGHDDFDSNRSALSPSPDSRLPTDSDSVDTDPDRRNRTRVVTALGFVGDKSTENDDLERCVTDWGGHPVRAAKGGVTALFGAPTSRGDDALRAARAGLDLLARFGGHAAIDTARFRFHLGVDGEVAGFDTAFSSLDALFGASGELGCSGASARHVAGHYRAERRGLDYSGRPRYAVTADAVIDSATADGGKRPFVGRRAELTQLAEHVRNSFAKRCPVLVELIGPAGIGKSELRRQFQRELESVREVDWLIGAAAPIASAEPFFVLRAAAPSWYRAVRTATAASRENGFAAARAWLLKKAALRPTIFVVEDAHWADEASVQFAHSLATGARGAPIVVLFISRGPAGIAHRQPASGQADAQGESGQLATIHLGPLTEAECAQLIRTIAPSLSVRKLAAVTTRSGGNPLFLSELVSHWRDVATESNSQIPETVEAAIQGRLDRLDPRRRAVLEAAAVIGSRFGTKLLAKLSGQRDGSSLDDDIHKLIEIGIFTRVSSSSREEYSFTSALVRDAAAAQLDPSLRMAMHHQIAEFLQNRPELAGPGSRAALAQHWEASGERVKAIAAYREAARTALSLFAYAEAVAAATRAEALIGPNHRDIELYELVADGLMQTDAQEAAKRLASALSLASHGDRSRRIRLLTKLGITASARADHAQALVLLERGLAIAEASTQTQREQELVVHAHLFGQLGWVLGYKLGNNDRGLAYSEHAVSLLERSDDTRSLARALGRLGGNYMRAGRWHDQLRCNQRNLKLATELGDSRGMLGSHINLGVVWTSLGDIEAALEHTCRGLEIAIRDGHPHTEPLIRNNLGGLLVERGDLDAAEAQLQTAIRLAAVVRQEYILPELHCLFARLFWVRQDFARAEKHAELSLEHARASTSSIDMGIAKRHLAAIVARRERERASALFGQALADLEGADIFELARTQIAQSRFLRTSKRSADWRLASELYASAKATFERLGAKRDLEMIDVVDDLR